MFRFGGEEANKGAHLLSILFSVASMFARLFRT